MEAVLLLVALGYAGARIFLGYPPQGGRALSRREWATVDAVAGALFPAGGGVAPSGAEAGVAAYADRLVAAQPPRQRTLMRALFFLLEHATLFFPAPGGLSGFRRFSSLRVEQRVAVIESWQTSGIFLRRLVFTSIRAICALGYFADPAVLRALHLAPYAIDSPIVEADLHYPRIGESRASVTLGEEDLTVARDAAPIALDAPLLAGYREGDA